MSGPDLCYNYLLSSGSLVPGLPYAAKVTMLKLLIIDPFKPVLEEHKAAGGFLLKIGAPGLLGLTWTRKNLQYMVRSYASTPQSEQHAGGKIRFFFPWFINILLSNSLSCLWPCVNAFLCFSGLHPEELYEDGENWRIAVNNYWSLLSPLIFSDHPKRPGDEDPSPPYNMLRNVLDMNAHFGGFNSALLDAKKSVWVMNVVPTSGPNYLPLILDRGYVGVLHDWYATSHFLPLLNNTISAWKLFSGLSPSSSPKAGNPDLNFLLLIVNLLTTSFFFFRCEAFPTYPRTYDLVHAEGLLSLETNQQRRCTMLDLFTEIDRILRPEVPKSNDPLSFWLAHMRWSL